MDKNILKISVLFLLFFTYNSLNAQDVIVSLEGDITHTIKQKIENNTAILFTRINEAYHKNSPSVNMDDIAITVDGKVNLDAIWQTSPFLIKELEIYENIITRNNSRNEITGYELRNIRIYIKEADKGDHSHEAVVVYNKQGEIVDFYLALDLQVYKNVMKEGNDVRDIRRRQLILDFVENFRTAYNRKDIVFLNKVFSDDALIIVGRKIKQRHSEMLNSNNKLTNYIKRTKKQYIQALKRVFKNNLYINVKFDDVRVVNHPKFKDIYGVTVKQEWHATKYKNKFGYSDKGYVFLMIDLRDEDNPIIHVRTFDYKDTFNLYSFNLKTFQN